MRYRRSVGFLRFSLLAWALFALPVPAWSAPPGSRDAPFSAEEVAPANPPLSELGTSIVAAGPSSPEIPAPPARPESLQTAWAIALQVDPQLAAQHFRRDATEHDYRAAQGLRLPTLFLDSAYTVRSNEPGLRFESPVPSLSLGDAVFPTAQAEDVSLNALVKAPLYTGGQIGHAVEAAEADRQAAALRAKAFAAELKLLVAEAYVNVLRTEADVSVSASNVRTLAGHAQDAEAFFHCQRRSRNELLGAQVALGNARQELLQAHHRLEAARCAYNRRLQRPLTLPVWLEPLSLEPLAAEVDVLTARAVAQRCDLAELSLRARSLQQQGESLLAENRPQVELRAGYSFQENRYQFPEGIASAAVVATWSPYDGGKTRHRANSLFRQADGVHRLHRDLESQIALQVRQAWLAVHETQRRLEVTQQAIEHAEENLHVGQMRYASGVAVGAEVLEAELLRVEAHRNHQQAHFDAILAQLRLFWAVGDL